LNVENQGLAGAFDSRIGFENQLILTVFCAFNLLMVWIVGFNIQKLLV